ncbi:PRKC apoptosis WT1 regulator protein [Oryzias latipes]|uniref:PRKC, apoptosis, WT1, regulator n=1 Tax=Oryzias latipes TaxID=8090 RepID=A0A3B3HWJ3_ORYLA|nr:PRKC apoptosis WT1 regulator protein [Oryzias latipes]XP_023808106.1 PRKC apoptosis WT1 regulator protein [Oryzias latipes]
MATGGFKPNATTDFLEEWKAKREKMRAKMLGDIAAATGANNSRHASPAGDSPERGASAGNCHPSPCAVVRSSSGGALRRAEEEAAHHPVSPESSPRKATPQADKAPCASPDSSPMACNDADKESPSPGKGKEKKSSGPSARKGKGQIEKRKLREKRRSTGVVSIPSNESLDELDDEDVGEKDRRDEEELVQANTCQNEAMTADPTSITETPRSGSSRHKSSTGSEDEVTENARQAYGRHVREGGAAGPGSLERRLHELEMELDFAFKENTKLLKVIEDKEDLIGKLKEEIDLLNRDLDDIEDENEQLKQENKTLLKVVGQLTR